MPSGPQVVILAAGLGLRLGALTESLPKALVEVGDRTLLDHALGFAAALRASEAIVVGGFGYDSVQARAGWVGEPVVRMVENRAFRHGNLLSLAAAWPSLRGDFFITNVDHVFSTGAAARVAAARSAQVTAWCEFERPLADDEMKVVVDPARRLRSISKSLRRYDGGYVGLTFVPQRRRADYEHAMDAARARNGTAAVVEDVLQGLADADVPVIASSLDKEAWCEVDTPDDHRRAQAMLAAGLLA